MPRSLASLLLFGFTVTINAQNWPQWGANGQHDSATSVVARRIDRIEQEVVIDPNAGMIESLAGGELIAHYPVPMIDGDDVIVLLKSGVLDDLTTRETQTWNVADMRRINGQLVTHWVYPSDWKPVPFGNASWEPVYHPAMTAGAVWAPAAGGTVDRINRDNGTRLQRINPFGSSIDPTIFVCGPLAVDARGNIYYNAIQLAAVNPWTNDVLNSWLVRIGADGAVTKATFASLTPNAPSSTDSCTGQFDTGLLPWPPSRDAVAPPIRCGGQRPGINIAPAIAPDGTVYTVSRTHFNGRWGFLVAANADLTPKWATSLRNRFHDGCDVTLPPSGTAGGCRAGSLAGVDPADNQPGSGSVNDNSTASPVVLPDGRVLYGAFTRYNFDQGHLMMFDANGQYVGAYGWGWDLTPAVYQHNGTYSIILKENHYAVGSYCNDGDFCPNDRSAATPADPESYYVTQLDPSLRAEWKFRSTNTLSCQRAFDGTLNCVSDHPDGFEWCVNAIAVDARGVVYADSEDGNLYAIAQGGILEQRILLRQALGAAYTPTAIGPDGRIYTQNDGSMFVITQNPKHRSVHH